MREERKLKFWNYFETSISIGAAAGVATTGLITKAGEIKMSDALGKYGLLCMAGLLYRPATLSTPSNVRFYRTKRATTERFQCPADA